MKFLPGLFFEALRFSLGFFRCPAEKKTNDPKNSPEKPRVTSSKFHKPSNQGTFVHPRSLTASLPLKNDGTGRLRLSFLGARLIFGGFCCWNFQGVSRIQIKPNSPLEAIGNLPEPVSGAADGVSWTELNFSPVFASFEYSTESVLERIFDDFCVVFDVDTWCFETCKMGCFWRSWRQMFHKDVCKAANLVTTLLTQLYKYTPPKITTKLMNTRKHHIQNSQKKTRQPTWNHSIVTCYPITLPLRLIGVLIGMHLLIERIPKRVNVNMGRVGLVQGTTCSKERVSSCSSCLRTT